MSRMSIASGAFDSDLLLGATQTVLDLLRGEAVLYAPGCKRCQDRGYYVSTEDRELRVAYGLGSAIAPAGSHMECPECKGTGGQFVLSSGKKASYYVDVARISLRQPGFAALAVIVANAALTARCTVVGGPLAGAAPLATAAMVGFSQARRVIEHSVALPSWAASRLRDQAAAFYLRDGEKEHGAGGRIVGRVPEGSRVMLVEDVVSTGRSMSEAVVYCRAQGMNVEKVFALVDRDKGVADYLRGQLSFVPYEYAFTMQDLGLERERVIGDGSGSEGWRQTHPALNQARASEPWTAED